MQITNLHHLAVPCLVDLKGTGHSPYLGDEEFYLNPRALIRYEPGGAVISSPNLYSSFLFADEELAACLKNSHFTGRGLPQHLVSTLLDNGIISPQPSGDGYREMSVSVSGLPTQVLLDVTSFCPCDCITCYHKLDLDGYVPPLADVLERISILKELGLGLFEVTGGEPFSRPDLEKILERLEEDKVLYYVVTNGEFLLNASDRLVALLRAGLGLAISLDGIGEEHDRVRHRFGLYDKMIAGVDKLRSQGVRVYFIATLNQENIGLAGRMVAVAKKYGTTVHFRPTIKTGAAADNNLEGIRMTPELIELLKNPNVRNGLLSTKKIISDSRYYGCGIRKRISVDSRGTLYPCVMDRLSPLGNISGYTAASLVKDLEAETRRLLSVNPVCRDCQHNKLEIVCGGFCRFSKIYNTKNHESHETGKI
ncbi:MAG: radical SAM protein [Patescibacteria group bacterium]